LRPRQSADSDHRSASATASAGSCCVGSAVSPRVRDSHSLSGLLWLLSLYLGLHPVNNHARQCPTTVRTPTPSGPPASSPSTIYIYDLWCAPPGHPPPSPQPCVHCPIHLSVAGTFITAAAAEHGHGGGGDWDRAASGAHPSALSTIASAHSSLAGS